MTDRDPQPRGSDDLHPFLYRAVAGLVLWTAIAAWGFFADRGHTPFVLADVTAFCVMAVAIPYALLQIWRRNRDEPHALPAVGRSVHDWLQDEIDTWGDHLKNSEAAVLILLPLAAIAVGLTLFAIVKQVVA